MTQEQEARQRMFQGAVKPIRFHESTQKLKDDKDVRRGRDTIDEVHEIEPQELNMGPDTTENINEIVPEVQKPTDVMWYYNPESEKPSNAAEEYRKMKESSAKCHDADIMVDIRKEEEQRNKNVSDDEDKKDPGDYYKYSTILKRMDDTHTRKNNDYGDAAYQGYKKYGDPYFLVQLHNKLSRLESLTINNKTQMVKDESIDDTLLDMANYAVMYLESRHRND